MTYLVLDVETTTSNKGNPFDTKNKLVCICLGNSDIGFTVYKPEDVEVIQSLISSCKYLVGFNIKFDLHWIRNLGIDFSNINVWDTQLGEFLLGNQQNIYPSLNDAAEKYGLDPKIDTIAENYWDKGIDTTDIPFDELSEYVIQDCVLTEQVYQKQVEIFKEDKRYRLFRLQNKDLLVLQEMEYNGIVFNTNKAMEHAGRISAELADLYHSISGFTGGIPINLNSNDHVSCLLYGGIVQEETRIPIGTYKTGAKVGQPRFKVVIKEYTLPRIIEPIKGTETKKPGYWKVNDDVLRSLKTNSKGRVLLAKLKRYAELEKLKGTYLEGWTKLITTMNWRPNMIYGSLNQCSVITGRLSSNKPNLQNADPITKTYCESRYDYPV